MSQTGHQHQREDELGCRKTENADPSRGREEESVLDDAQDAGDSNKNVVVVIVVLALIFIVVMTYFVAQMPQKP